MQRFLLICGLLVSLAVAAAIIMIGASGDFIESTEETRLGLEIGVEQRLAVQALSELDLPPSTVYHAYHFESALDQRMVALVTMDAKDIETLIARPPLAGASWEPVSNLPTAASDLSGWPSSWGEPTVGGRRSTLDTAPGRQLVVSIGDADTDSHPVLISWHTY